MQQTDRTAFAKLLMGVGVLYGKAINEVLIEIYWQALVSFEFHAVKAAFNAHVMHPEQGKFLPKPADIVEYLQGSSDTQALKAWSKVKEAMGTVGSYDSVVFDDALIHAVISDMGGWIALCQMKEETLSFRAREFERRYRAYVLHPPLSVPSYLIGKVEHQNGLQGYGKQTPTLIGDKQKARQVLEKAASGALIEAPGIAQKSTSGLLMNVLEPSIKSNNYETKTASN